MKYDLECFFYKYGGVIIIVLFSLLLISMLLSGTTFTFFTVEGY